MCGCQGAFSGCPAAGYPTPPPAACGCGNPGPYYPAPQGFPAVPQYPAPTPARWGGGYFGRTLDALQDAAAGVGASVVDDLGSLDPTGKICKTVNDGLYKVTTCCTPGIGRYGVKVAVCLKVSRPVDPWGAQAPPGAAQAPPSWPAPM